MQDQINIQGDYVEWANHTVLNPIGLGMVLICGIATLTLSRKHAVIPMLFIACFIAPAQRIVIGTLDFNLLRIMVIFAWVRLFSLREYQNFRWKPLDKLIIVWALVGTTIYTVQQGSLAALVYKIGVNFEALGLYFFFRCVIRSLADVDRLLRGIVVLSIPVAVALSIEKQTGHNEFAIFGGVPEITLLRQGKLRAQGAFAHPILAGTFWAALLPMMAGLWFRNVSGKMFASVGIMTTGVIVWACASSTPIAATAAAIVGAAVWPFRGMMRWVRWGVFGTLVSLHLVMKAPVWNLLARIDLVGGSTGYQRYALIDAAVHHFSEWAIIGTQSTAAWGYFMFDVTNQYILEGVRGGLITMLLFIAQIVLAFGAIGRLRRVTAGVRRDEAMVWAMGVALFVHVAAFIAVSYFGQIIVIWYMLLAMACSLDPGPEAACAPSLSMVRTRSRTLMSRPSLAKGHS